MSGLKKWITRLKDGDQSAFLPLYEKTAPGIMRFLLWKTGGDKPVAEDIMQETFVRFLLHLDRLESVEDLSIQSYLLQTAKNCLIDKVGRAAHCSKPHVDFSDIPDLNDARQDLRQEKAVELRELQVAMDHLNEKDSEIIWLRDGLGMSHREVADQIGISEQATRQAYVRAKRNLITEMGGRYAPQMS